MALLGWLVIVLGYISIVVFTGGLIYRIRKWISLSIGVNWELFPKPTGSVTIDTLLGRVFAIPTLFWSSKWVLILAIIMHIAILISVILHSHLFVFFGTEDIIDLIGTCAAIVAGILVLYFLLRRIFVKGVRDISSPSDYFWLIWLLTIVAIGAFNRMFGVISVETYQEFARSVLTFKPYVPEGVSILFFIHALLGEIYLMYIVSGKMMHSIGWIFGQHVLVSERGVKW